VRVNIVGVSTSLSTTSQNLTLARDRAEVIATFLADQGVVGDYTVSVSTTFTVRDAERSTRTLAENASQTPLDRPLTSGADKPLTSAAISFAALVSSTG
jgi:outer membrane protein OmpA-like peptidoglycan-associated protein